MGFAYCSIGQPPDENCYDYFDAGFVLVLLYGLDIGIFIRPGPFP